ncbi:MAG: hypothetical protein ACRYFX_08645 [Janthinobacterium lividum]
MKIIQPGRSQQGWAKEYTCTGKGNKGGGCGAVLLVEYADLRRTVMSFCGRDTDYFPTFRCPSCGVLTDIPAEDVPGPLSDLPHGSGKSAEWVKDASDK